MPPLSQNLNRFDSADILESMKENIFQAWELECRQIVPAAKSQNRPDFINAIPKFLDELVAILRNPNQQLKNEKASEIACAHGEERAVLNEYTLDQVIFEYQILRVILIEALETKGQVDIEGRKTIHEFMDQSIRKAASRYTDIELNRATALILENTKFKQEAEYEREKISAIFTQSPGALAVLEGPDHIFTRVNEAYVSLLFGNRKDLVGNSVKDAVPEAVQQGFIALLDCVYNTGVPYVGTETPIELLQIDGTLKKFYLNFVYQPLRGNSGNIVGVVAAIADMTNQVESRKLVQDSAKALRAAQDQLVYNLETSRLQLYDFFMQAPLPMVIMEGPQHKFVIANPHYEKFVGRSVVGKTLAEAFSVEEAALFIPIVDNVYKTGISFSGSDMPVNLTNNVGETIAHWMDIGFHPFRSSDGSIKGVFAILQDMTEHVQSKKKLVDQTDALKKSKKIAEGANEAKTSFLANMSHEIRTPLGAILGFTDILKGSALNVDERNQYLEIISRNGQALVKLIDDILDLSKVEAGKLEIEQKPICLKTLTNEVMAMFSDRAAIKGLYLKLDISGLADFKIHSDAVRIRQVLVNLIGNAIKFTNFGGVALRCTHELQQKGLVKINFSVEDTGIGFSPEHSGELFRPFSQGDNQRTRKYGGTGLGLALSRKLGRALGGDVTIEDCTLGKGCSFKFSFVTSWSQSVESNVPQVNVKSVKIKSGQLSNIKLLVVDDSRDNRVLLDVILKAEGAILDFAENGNEALEKALKHDYDIILLDIQLPGLDGYEVIAKLKSENYQKPVIALTAHAMLEEKHKALEVGFADHVTKPIDRNILIKSILKHYQH